MRRPPKAFAIIMVLMLCTLLLVAVIGFMSSQSGQYQSSALSLASNQALLLAQAGLEDATFKLNTDVDFPPADAGNSNLFSYSEQLDPDFNYTVTIDKRLTVAPWVMWSVQSTGTVTSAGKTLCKRTLSLELDVSRNLRDITKTPNPNYFKIIQIYDRGSH